MEMDGECIYSLWFDRWWWSVRMCCETNRDLLEVLYQVPAVGNNGVKIVSIETILWFLQTVSEVGPIQCWVDPFFDYSQLRTTRFCAVEWFDSNQLSKCPPGDQSSCIPWSCSQGNRASPMPILVLSWIVIYIERKEDASMAFTCKCIAPTVSKLIGDSPMESLLRSWGLSGHWAIMNHDCVQSTIRNACVKDHVMGPRKFGCWEMLFIWCLHWSPSCVLSISGFDGMVY